MTLNTAQLNETYIVKDIQANDKIKNFLLTLGCYEGTEITILSKLGGNLIVNIKDGRYALDEAICKTIIVEN